MAAKEANQYWQFRDKHGRDYKYTPDLLWEELKKYSQWVKDNPLYEEKVFHAAGIVTTYDAKKMRAMTIKGFCLFADICEKTFANYRENEDFIQVITRIEDVIYSQKFEGAAADLLNPNIIARDLGLRDKKDLTSDGEKITGFNITIKGDKNE